MIGVLDFALKKYLPQGGTAASSTRSRSCCCSGGRKACSAPVGMTAPPTAGPITRRRARWPDATGCAAWEPIPWLLALAFYFVVPELSRLRHRAPGHDPLRALARSGARLRGHRDPRPCRVLRRRRLHGRACWPSTASGTSRSPGLIARGAGGGAHRSRLRRRCCLRTHGPDAADAHALHHGAPGGGRQSCRTTTPAASTASTACRSRRCSAWFEFNPLYPRTQYLYVLAVLFVCFVFVRTLVYSPFGQSLTGIRENTLRMHAVGAPVRARLVHLLRHLGGDRRHRRRRSGRRPTPTSTWARSASTARPRCSSSWSSAATAASTAPFVGAVAYMALSHFLSKIYPTAWQLGLRAPARGHRAVRAATASSASCEAAVRGAGVTRPRRDATDAPLLETRGALPELRRAGRRARHRLPARGRRAPRADRSERRRQDHVHQSADRGHRGPRAGEVLLKRPRHHCASPQAERVKLGIARTFQINRLFRGLSVLENVYIAVAERVGAAPSMLRPAGRAPGRGRGVDGSSSRP